MYQAGPSSSGGSTDRLGGPRLERPRRRPRGARGCGAGGGGVGGQRRGVGLLRGGRGGAPGRPVRRGPQLAGKHLTIFKKK